MVPLGGDVLGVAILSTERVAVLIPKLTVFVAYFAFLNIDVLLTERIRTNLGGEFVCPIPFERVQFGTGG